MGAATTSNGGMARELCRDRRRRNRLTLRRDQLITPLDPAQLYVFNLPPRSTWPGAQGRSAHWPSQGAALQLTGAQMCTGLGCLM